MIDSEKLTGAREFILQEHQGLYSLYQSTKEVGDNRLNFYVTFVSTAAAESHPKSPLTLAFGSGNPQKRR